MSKYILLFLLFSILSFGSMLYLHSTLSYKPARVQCHVFSVEQLVPGSWA